MVPTMEADTTTLGSGIYSVPEAARLLQEPSGKVRRWVEGYSRALTVAYTVSAQRKDYRPVVRASISTPGPTNVSFLDLVELLFVKAFRSLGVTMPKIRAAADYMARELQIEGHPFARQQLKTDGADVFWQFEQLDGDGKVQLVVISKQGQRALPQVIESYLNNVDFEGFERVASRWWPLGRDTPIVVDPRVSFGQPVIVGPAIPTSAIADYAQTGEPRDEVADWFGIDLAEVDAALRYERSLSVA